jgi:uncharacterized membrane protein
MKSFLRFLQFLALGTWVGSIIFFSFVVAPGLFGILSSRDEAGAVVGYSLDRLHSMGVIEAAIYLVAALAMARSLKALARPRAIDVILMLLLTLCSAYVVIPRMDTIRLKMPSLDAAPAGDPQRAEFDRLHRISVGIEGTVLLIGIAALFLTVREETSGN